MTGVFEIFDKDLMGRIGRIYTSHGIVETPELAPVVNPVKNVVPVNEIIQIGFHLIMTNAYIIKKHYEALALDLGVHRLLGYDGPMMTDSGAYQLMEYRSIEVDPVEIVKYQEGIGTDIGVILDIPTRYRVPKHVVINEVKETVRRAEKSIKVKERDDMILIAPVQGGRYLDLVKWSAKKLSALNFEMYGIGGPTQMMEQYKYDELVDLIATAKSYIPPEKPVHLFGAGNPLTLSLAVALGIDTFDSASYAIYARDLRYMLPDRIVRVERLKELPCLCPVCKRYDIESFINLPRHELVREVALHNLHVIKAELKRIRQAIFEGTLWELLEVRARSHPNLMRGLRRLRKYVRLIEKFDPVTKPIVRGLFFYPQTSLYRPEVYRHKIRILKNYTPPKCKCLLLLPETTERPFSRYGPISLLYSSLREFIENEVLHIAIYSLPFGLIPVEIDEIYPLSQYEYSGEPTLGEKLNVIKFIAKYLTVFKHHYEKVIIHMDIKQWGVKFYEILLEKLIELMGRENVLVTPLGSDKPYDSLAIDELVETIKRNIA